MKRTKIEWAHHSFSTHLGCTKISDGCTNCYAATLARRFPTLGSWEPGAPRVRTSAAYWRQPLAWDRAAAAVGERHRVFCNSMSDVLDPKAPQAWRADLLELITTTKHLDWLLLSKRIAHARKLLPALPENVWLGTSVENQQEADRRLPLLRALPARLKFISAEPLLERVTLDLRDVSWVICGGESGPGARPMQLDWARSIIAQCKQAGVACFVKQLGGRSNKRGDPASWPADLRVREIPQCHAC